MVDKTGLSSNVLEQRRQMLEEWEATDEMNLLQQFRRRDQIRRCMAKQTSRLTPDVGLGGSGAMGVGTKPKTDLNIGIEVARSTTDMILTTTDSKGSPVHEVLPGFSAIGMQPSTSTRSLTSSQVDSESCMDALVHKRRARNIIDVLLESSRTVDESNLQKRRQSTGLSVKRALSPHSSTFFTG
ncbi:unnamed protein product [Protopolystoma xenopodis]|uniref:Uncharacterized protein n=1 Tax=Protopolystoma xenopodis TaxID=117903 RepID=A0A3S5BAP1_9PLAT|nr:unnamed protein product [Protopolystoma xenopodis]